MNKTTLSLILLFVVLVPAQAIFFNNLVLFNVAIPFAFLYLLITLPVTMKTNVALTVGFLTGLAVDILSDTPGVNALAATILTFERRGVFHLYMASDVDLASQRPSLRNMGTAAFLKYALTLVVIYCTEVFLIEAFMVWNLKLLVLRIICSSLFSFIIIYAMASLAKKSYKAKRT